MKPVAASDIKSLAVRRRVASICIAAGLLALGSAIALQLYAHVVPCALCLVERWPYRALIALGVVGALLPRSFGGVVAGLAVAVVGVGIALACVHIGVEQHLWKSPFPECNAPVLRFGADLPAFPAKPCDEPTYLLPSIPVSLAALNLLYQLPIFGWLLYQFPRTRRPSMARQPMKRKTPDDQPNSSPTRRHDEASEAGADDTGGPRG